MSIEDILDALADRLAERIDFARDLTDLVKESLGQELLVDFRARGRDSRRPGRRFSNCQTLGASRVSHQGDC